MKKYLVEIPLFYMSLHTFQVFFRPIFSIQQLHTQHFCPNPTSKHFQTKKKNSAVFGPKKKTTTEKALDLLPCKVRSLQVGMQTSEVFIPWQSVEECRVFVTLW